MLFVHPDRTLHYNDKMPVALNEKVAPRWLGADLGSNSRWVICWLLFLVTSINYLDRQVFGILIPDLQQQMHISELAYGRLVMAFQMSYALMMIAAGRILDRIGARLGLALAVVVWSVAEIGHVLARTTIGFGLARFVLGAGEAANFPGCMKVIADCRFIPGGGKATATGIVNSATAVGAIAAPIAVPLLAMHYGWQSAFLVTGIVGFLWVAAWYGLHLRQRGQHRPSVSHRVKRDTALVRRAAISWRRLLAYRQFWAFAIARMLVDPIWYFYLFWLPKFLAQERGITGTAAAPYLSAVSHVSDCGPDRKREHDGCSDLLGRGRASGALDTPVYIGIRSVSERNYRDSGWVRQRPFGLSKRRHRGVDWTGSPKQPRVLPRAFRDRSVPVSSGDARDSGAVATIGSREARATVSASTAI
jgi:MFS family permease